MDGQVPDGWEVELERLRLENQKLEDQLKAKTTAVETLQALLELAQRRANELQATLKDIGRMCGDKLNHGNGVQKNQPIEP